MASAKAGQEAGASADVGHRLRGLRMATTVAPSRGRKGDSRIFSSHRGRSSAVKQSHPPHASIEHVVTIPPGATLAILGILSS